MTLDRKRIGQIADWVVVAVAASLPWSTSATSILLGLWLLVTAGSLDVASVRRQIATAAGGLPALLWLLAAIGMLWADVSWSDRLDGLGGFHRLLIIPLLLAQFQRSDRGVYVLYGFLAGAVALLLVSWILTIDPALTWLRGNADHPAYGVPVKDVISQSTVFVLCTFALLWCVGDRVRERNWLIAIALAVVAALFLADLIFVAISRGDVIAALFLVVLFGWRQFGWKGAVIACLLGCVLAAAAWSSSPYLRDRLNAAVTDVEAYRTTHVHNDVGDHVEFLRKSFDFVRQAPLIGHGTGSIRDLFRQSAAGQSGAAGIATANPHNQIFAVAIQLGLMGAAVLLAMWIAHYLLFRGSGLVAWIGAVVVAENVITSLTSSHLFDFTHGSLYVVGVGVTGGMMLRSSQPKPDVERSIDSGQRASGDG
jgi:O-antigen ligase